MKAVFGAVLLMVLGSAEAVHHKKHHHHHKFGPFHGRISAEHDLIALQGDDKPPPEIPGGHSDMRYLSKWRKPWPQGAVDNAANDEDVLNMRGSGRKAKEEKPVITYPWTLDSDIIDSQQHLEDVQGIVEHEMPKHIYWDRGYEMLNRGSKAIKSWYL